MDTEPHRSRDVTGSLNTLTSASSQVERGLRFIPLRGQRWVSPLLGWQCPPSWSICAQTSMRTRVFNVRGAEPLSRMVIPRSALWGIVQMYFKAAVLPAFSTVCLSFFPCTISAGDARHTVSLICGAFFQWRFKLYLHNYPSILFPETKPVFLRLSPFMYNFLFCFYF